MNVALVDAPETDGKGNRRTFSIVSAPADAERMFATRMRDSSHSRNLKRFEISAGRIPVLNGVPAA
jgi:hypothetical protein